MNTTKGFTLIELLLVLCIIAVLSVVVILTLNPAELTKQSRDASRLSDTAVIKKALSLYLSGVTSPVLGVTKSCYTSNSTTTNRCGLVFGVYFNIENATTSRSVNGTGWIPVDFTQLSSGAPFSSLPSDPVNDATYYYAYAASTTSQTFEIDANMESSKYQNGGSKDVESTDGGSNVNWFEAGTAAGFAF